MISKEEIKRLADLARIEIKEEEVEGLRGEMDSILDYVGQVGSIAPLNVTRPNGSSGRRGEGGDIDFEVINVLREDGKPTPSGTYTKELVAEFPESQKGYLKVKKIL